MRDGLKCFCVVMLLCAVLPSQTPAPPTDGVIAPPTNQLPAGPLEEPKKPAATEGARPAPAQFEVNARTGQDQQVGEIKLMTRYTELNGDSARSFRVPGHNNLAEFHYFSDQGFLANHRIQVLSSFRGTDDRSIDPERLSLQKGYVRIFGDRDEFIVGDALVTFSRLTFNQNAKGGYANLRLGEGWRLAAFSGIFIDRYGSLYKDIPGRPYMAATSGVRVERNILNRDSKMGVNFSDSRDQVSSLPVALAGTSPAPITNTVTSLDARVQTNNGLRFDSELAYSFTDFDRRSSSGCPAPCDTRTPQPLLNRSQGDYALRTEGSYRYRGLSFRGSFVRYQPMFASQNARQIADMQDFAWRTSYDLTRWLTTDGTLRRSNNDLRGQLPFQTTLWGPEMKFIFHDLPWYERATFELGYRHRDVRSADGTSIERSVRIPYVEATMPIKPMFLTLGYERRQAHDRVDGSQASNTDRVSAGVRGVYDRGGWRINPSLRYELERQSHRPRGAAVPLPDFTRDRDSNRLASLTFYVEAPKWFLMEGAFRSSSATIFGPVSFVAPDGGAGYSRPSYKGAITYKFRNDENTLFTFGLERNNNYYRASANYDERIWSGTIVYRFGKRR
jgi:hypothetical protein